MRKEHLLVSAAMVTAAWAFVPTAAGAQTTAGSQAGAPVTAEPAPLDAAAQTGTPVAAGATPEETTGDIVVTATRMGATSLQKTPIAVSVLSGADLDRSGTTDVRDLAQQAPNFNVSQSGPNPLIFIRGIGTSAVLNGSDPDVTTQSDGVYLARAFEEFSDFFDVERLEILRGPQGTLYGRNAVGGVINIISRQPTDDFTGRAQLTVGTYATIQGQGYVSGPLVKGLLDFSVAANYLRHDGYVKNLIASGEDDNSANHGGVRAQLRFRPASWVEATTRFDYSKADENSQVQSHLAVPAVAPYINFTVPNPALFSSPIANSIIGDYHHTAHDQPTKLTKTEWGIAEDINFDLSDQLTLKSLTAYRQGRYSYISDTDATEIAALTTVLADRSRQFSQEFNLNGHFGDIDFVGGLYYFRENQHNIGIAATPASPGRTAAQATYAFIQPFTRSTSKAAFAQASYKITPRLKVTAGARYTEDEKYFVANTQLFLYPNAPALGPEIPGLPFVYTSAPKFHAFTPKAGLEWQATDDVFAYASYTKGFKSGGNNSTVGCRSTLAPADYAACIGTIIYQPEKLDSYEAGIKTFLFDRRVTANLTGFYYNYKNLQVQSALAPGIVNIGNAATATVKGLEFETTAKLTDRLTFSGNASYLDARYDTYLQASVAQSLRYFVSSLPNYNAATNTVNASGNRLTNSPRFSFNMAAQYTQPISIGSVYARAEYSHQSRVYFEATNSAVESQNSFGLLNLSVGYTSTDANWTVAVVAKNVTDKEYLVSAFGSGLVPAGVSGNPRTVLLRIARKF